LIAAVTFLLTGIDGIQFTLLETVVFKNLRTEIKEFFAVIFYQLTFLRSEVHLEQNSQISRDTFSFLGSQSWQLFEISHETFIP
jgi:hypothetical protein